MRRHLPCSFAGCLNILPRHVRWGATLTRLPNDFSPPKPISVTMGECLRRLRLGSPGRIDMRLLLFNLATDVDDPALGFTACWIAALAKRVERIYVITMRLGQVA